MRGCCFFYEGEFVSALSGKLKPSPWFYVTTLIVVVASSIIYTPFSYGISMYFLKSKMGKAKFRDIFYLFKDRRLLLKAILTDTIRRLITTALRILVLFFAVVIEIAVLFLCSDVQLGLPIKSVLNDIMQNASRGMFVSVTVIMWCIVIAVFLLIKLKFILCKYVLINDPESTVLQCIKVGHRAIDKKILITLRFYVKYLAIYIFTFFTLGLAGAKRVNKSRDSFCTYAVRLVSNY